MEELKKCPFCGGEAMLKINYGFDGKVISAFVYCKQCGAEHGWNGYERLGRIESDEE